MKMIEIYWFIVSLKPLTIITPIIIMIITSKTLPLQGRGESQLICGDMLYSIFDNVTPSPSPCPLHLTDWIWQTCLTGWLLLQRMGPHHTSLWTKEGLCDAWLDNVVPGWWLLIEGLLFPPQSPRIWRGVSSVLAGVLSPWQMSSLDMPKMYNWSMGWQRGETAPLLYPDISRHS